MQGPTLLYVPSNDKTKKEGCYFRGAMRQVGFNQNVWIKVIFIFAGFYHVFICLHLAASNITSQFAGHVLFSITIFSFLINV